MTDTTAQHIAARNDEDLFDRLVATAEQQGIDQAEQFVQMNLGKLVSTKVDGDNTITTVHAYATGVREDAFALKRCPEAIDLPAAVALINALTAPPPGKNPGAVTDIHLATAIMVVWSPETGDAS